MRLENSGKDRSVHLQGLAAPNWLCSGVTEELAERTRPAQIQTEKETKTKTKNKPKIETNAQTKTNTKT